MGNHRNTGTQGSFQAEASAPSAAHCYRTTECQSPENPTGKLRPKEGNDLSKVTLLAGYRAGVSTQKPDYSSYTKQQTHLRHGVADTPETLSYRHSRSYPRQPGRKPLPRVHQQPLSSVAGRGRVGWPCVCSSWSEGGPWVAFLNIAALDPKAISGAQRLPLWLSQPCHPQMWPITTLNTRLAFPGSSQQQIPRHCSTRQEPLTATAVNNSDPLAGCPVLSTWKGCSERITAARRPQCHTLTGLSQFCSSPR